MEKEISEESKMLIKGALANCEKFDLDYAANCVLKGNYCPKNGLFIIELTTHNEHNFAASMPSPIENILGEINKKYPDVDKTKVFFVDYTGLYVGNEDGSSYEVIPLDTNVGSFIDPQRSKFYKTFKEFQEKYF